MADYALINGHRYGWASIEAHLEGEVARDFTEINYSTDNDPGEARGKGMRVIGRTRGEAKHDGSMTMNKAEAQKFIARLGNGFTLKSFGITVSYEEAGEGGVITDRLIGCRIKKIEDAPKVGNEPLTVKFDLHIMRITYNGFDPFEDK